MNLNFTPEIVLAAYSQGIFPMGHAGGQIAWYSPDPRCIIDLQNFHVSRRLARTYRQNKFELKVNSAFDQVIRICARSEAEGIWITDDIVRVYTQLHERGFAHSVEAYKDGKLAGGLYGISLGGAFMGESMFHIERDASKICLMYLVERLRERNFVLLDSQYMTSHLSTFNAISISRAEYLIRLEQALKLSPEFV
ncbi:MAG: leucyl/phenylalanyl-tRNA--protein transferase [Cyanobacteria bacterium TGS_CYA1]|nr:leucyl/phenylalanyl-tRNA--protein transferase [Cyanobacteria bacterium TGS_CYA1]